MTKTYSQIVHTIYNTPWLITEEGLETILAIVDRKMTGEEMSFEQIAEMRDKNEERGRIQIPEQPGIAVMPIHGSIFPKANLLTDFSGGVSMEKFINDFNM